jgi:hypothetical protein
MNKLTVSLLLIGLTALLLGTIYLLWIASEPPTPNGPPHALVHCNFIILLDLSDRIDTIKAPNQVTRDKEVIRSAFSVFSKIVKKKLFVNSRDIFQVAIAFQPSNYDSTLFQLTRNLKINMRELKVTEKRTKFPQLEHLFWKSIDLLYHNAVKNSEFLGSDIWSFFRDDIDNYIIPSTSSDSISNFLIILTDGYLEFEKSVLPKRPRQGNQASFMEMHKLRGNPNWESEFDKKNFGLIPIKKDFHDLHIIMLEVSPKNPLDPTEFAQIKKYWSKWFNDMSIQTTDRTINKNQLPIPKVKEVLEKFIQEN